LTRFQELSAWAATALWLGSYYRTYARTVQAQVTEVLAKPEDFRTGPLTVTREGPRTADVGFVVRDRNYVSARYFVDAYRFAGVFAAVLAEVGAEQAAAACT